MKKILIIADDLTGAADCGVAFARRGLKATVVMSRAGAELALDQLRSSAEVLAVDADTRGLSPEDAGDAVARIVNQFANSDWRDGLLFKKVDSTLRGNVAAELARMLEAMRAHAPSGDRVTILFAPAFPAQGRTTVNGVHMVNGRPLHETEIGRGSCASIGAMLSEAGLCYGPIRLELIRAGADSLSIAMQRAAENADIVVCDAETEYDLSAIAKAGMALGPRTVWAGSAGLAAHLPDVAGCAQGAKPRPQTELQAPGHVQGPTLFVVGSAAEISVEQARRLAATPGVSAFTLAGSAGDAKDAALISSSLERGNDVLVRLDSCETSARNKGWAEALGRLLEPCGRRAGALVATGGETARAILDAWGVESMRLLGEVETGLPYSVVECGGRTILVLTKAGGFGTPDTLIRCRNFIRGLARESDIAGLNAAGRKR